MSAKSRQSLFRAKLAQHILSASKGFTLIELLVVIVIVGILSAVAIPQFLNQVRRSRTAEAQAALTAVGRASEVYRLDFSQYPSDYTTIKYGCPSTYCGVKGDRYMNDPWSAPNYTDYQRPPIFLLFRLREYAGTHSIQRAPYITASGSKIQCTIGLGAQETAVATLSTFVGKSCNVFD
jgi:type II secretion system protein G